MTGTYSAIKFTDESSYLLYEFCSKLLNVKALFSHTKYHSTIIYSRKLVSFNENRDLDSIIIDPKTYQFQVFDSDPSYLVLTYENDTIHNLWQNAMDLGATWDFDTYRPHISIGIVDKNFKVPENLPPFPIVANKIYTELLDVTYQPSVVESTDSERRRRKRA